MANIADGYLSIEFKSSNLKVAEELLQSISESGLFEYGGDHDISANENGVDGGFSCRWSGDDCWDWINIQMSLESRLSEEAKQILITSYISGGSSEAGCEYRDRVEKQENEIKLRQYISDYQQENLASACKIIGAFELQIGEKHADYDITLIKEENYRGGDGKEITRKYFKFNSSITIEILVEINLGNQELINWEYITLDGEPVNKEEESIIEENSTYLSEALDELIGDRDEFFHLVK